MWQYYELHVIELDIFFKMSLIYILDSLSITKYEMSRYPKMMTLRSSKNILFEIRGDALGNYVTYVSKPKYVGSIDNAVGHYVGS